MAPQRGTGFTDIGQYLDANQGTLANEAGGLAGSLGGALDKSVADSTNAVNAAYGSGVTPSDYSSIAGYDDAKTEQKQAQDDISKLGSPGGIQDALQKRGDSADQSNFDAQLLVGNSQLGALQQRSSSLGDYLNQYASGQASRAAQPVTVDDPDGWNGVTPTGPGSGNPIGYGHPGAGDPTEPRSPVTPINGPGNGTPGPGGGPEGNDGPGGKKKTPYGGF